MGCDGLRHEDVEPRGGAGLVATDILKDLVQKTSSRILLLVCDGLGGLPHPESGKTELETARTPNLDALAQRSNLGIAELVAPGITPGSGPGHLSIFGYDPIQYQVGRGALSAIGIGLDMTPQDVAARINFCTLDEQGRITDRRAGRIPTEESARLAALLQARVTLPGVEAIVRPEMDYRGVLLLRGEGLSDQLSDTDPQITAVPPLPVRPTAPGLDAQHTAELVNRFLDQARQVLRQERPANGVLLRGFAKYPDLPKVADRYQLKAGAVAIYPMYRGLARLVGMELLPTGKTMRDQIETVRQHWSEFDFFFVHFKYTDSAGEDGDFARKVRMIEEVDGYIPDLLALGADVFAITGDHSTPAVLKAHSWHPVPFMLHSRWVLPDEAERFTERHARRGSLGHFHMSQAMVLLLANALKLLKYGA
ncbi:MAG: 2,3-bisphosphoglycerate-independent phosphoglycerate mutase [Chloroflexi bacterium]|nr:2,3-bisphosphoglycerate-independent phosphoglycerate mutase [Chloroflexota bacterium]